MMKPPESLLNARVSASTAQGGRKYMEDEYCIVHYRSPPFLPNKSQHDSALHKSFIFLGIFDGHGGDMAARYTRQNLCQNIVRQRDFWANDDRKVCLAIHRGFVRTHKAMMGEVGKWPKTASGLPSTSGTTASVVFIMNGKYYTGHVGDSRIVLARQDKYSGRWIPCALTRDHKPESTREKRRIEAAGGRVMNKAGVGRVVWNRPKPDDSESFDIIPFLAVARSLGDLWSLNRKLNTFIVSPEPDVKHIPIDPSDRCLILASDGLWNMLTLKSAVNAVQDFEESQSNSPYDSCGLFEQQSPASALLGICLNRWSQSRFRADNTTVLAAMIDQNCHLQNNNNKIMANGTSHFHQNSDCMLFNNSYYDLSNSQSDDVDDNEDMENSKFVGDTIHSFKFDSELVESCFTTDDLLDYDNANGRINNDNNNNFDSEISSVLDSVLNRICLDDPDEEDVDEEDDEEEEVNRNQSPLSSVSTPDENELSDEQLSAINFVSLHSSSNSLNNANNDNNNSLAQNFDCQLTIDKCAISNHNKLDNYLASRIIDDRNTSQSSHKVIFQSNTFNINSGTNDQYGSAYCSSTSSTMMISNPAFFPQHRSHHHDTPTAASFPQHRPHHENSNCDNLGPYHLNPCPPNSTSFNYEDDDENALFAPSPNLSIPLNNGHQVSNSHCSTYRTVFSEQTPPELPPKLSSSKRSYDVASISSSSSSSSYSSFSSEEYSSCTNGGGATINKRHCSFAVHSSSETPDLVTVPNPPILLSPPVPSLPCDSTCPSLSSSSSSSSSCSTASAGGATASSSMTKLLHSTGQCIKELISNGFGATSTSNHHITDI